MLKPHFRKAYSKILHTLQNQAYVLVYGLRHTGKTTFIKAAFSEYQYVSIRKKHLLDLLREDPYRFFSAFEGKTIFDDIEQCSGFISLFKRYSSLFYQQGQVILISSIALPEVKENTSVQFFPLSVAEWKQNHQFVARLEYNILQGGFLQGKDSRYNAMLRKTIETQMTLLLDVRDLKLIESFFKASLKQINQALHLKSLAQEVGITAPTAASWMEKLELLGLVYLLPAYPHTFGKRAAKGPKFYVTDTGLACHFLKIDNEKELALSPYFRALAHNFYLMELRKKNEIEFAPKKLYYWKESNGHEIDLLIENPTSVDIFEFSSSTEYQTHLRREADYFDEISNGKVLSKSLVYGGFRNQMYRDVELVSWQQLTS